MFIDFNRRLPDSVLVFFPSGQIEREGLVLRRQSLLQLLVATLHGLFRQVIANIELGVAGRKNSNVIDHTSVFHLAIGRLNEAELVDSREARKRRNQSDVRTFRRLNRTDAAVVRWVNIAHFETRALSRKPARPKRRQSSFMSDLRKRIRLIHELRQLRRAEKLSHGCGDRLRVNEIARHRCLHLLMNRHLLFDRTFHSDEANSELILEKLADRSHAPIAKMINVVGLADSFAHLEDIVDHIDEVTSRERLFVQAFALRLAELNIRL